MSTDNKKYVVKALTCALKMMNYCVPGPIQIVRNELIDVIADQYMEGQYQIPIPKEVLSSYDDVIIAAVEDMLTEATIFENINQTMCISAQNMAIQMKDRSKVFQKHDPARRGDIFAALQLYLTQLQNWAASSPPLLVNCLSFLYKRIEEQSTNSGDNHQPKPCVDDAKYERYVVSHISNYFATGINQKITYHIHQRDMEFYACGSELLKEVKEFISYNWMDEFKRWMHKDTLESELILRLLAEYKESLSNDDLVGLLITRLNQVLDDPTYNKKRLDAIIQHLSKTHFENCMMISAYYGSGKTRLSIELARQSVNWNKKIVADSELHPMFLLVNCGNTENLEQNIQQELGDLFGSAHSIDEYLHCLPEKMILTIVLDDIHKLLQGGKTYQDIFTIINRYSRINVKWIIMIQPGYSKQYDILDFSQNERYSYEFRTKLKNYQNNNWFQLDDWNKDIGIVRVMIEQVPAIDFTQWKWWSKVSAATFFNPLFANVLILYYELFPGDRYSLETDLCFPRFCSKYYEVLGKGSLSVNQSTIILANYFLESYSLLFRNPETKPIVEQDKCNELINHGLLNLIQSRYDRSPKYCGTPDIVWYFQMAVSAKEQWVTDNNTFKVSIRDNRNEKNGQLFDCIMSMLIIMLMETALEESNYTVIEPLWETLLEQNFEQPLLESGFKLDRYLRVLLVKFLMKHEDILHQNYEVFLRICVLGELSGDLLEQVIIVSLKNYRDQVKANVRTFVYMLQRCYIGLEWEQILKIFSILNPINELGLDKATIEKIGCNLAKSIVVQATEKNELDKAIEKALYVIEEDRKLGEIKEKCPSNLCDYFSQYFCNEVIVSQSVNAFEKLQRVNWYHFKNKLRWNEQRRNILLTLSLAYVFRETDDEEYSEWYVSFVEKLSTHTSCTYRKLALYLVAHSGLKDNSYAIQKNSRLGSVAKELYTHPDLHNECTRGSLKRFYRQNFPEFFRK